MRRAPDVTHSYPNDPEALTAGFVGSTSAAVRSYTAVTSTGGRRHLLRGHPHRTDDMASDRYPVLVTFEAQL